VAGYDVVVVGGGVAGAAAAIAAARNGSRTCLIEKEFGLGGLATLGNVIEYLPICDGAGHKVCGGLAEDLLKLSIENGPGEIPACWLTDDGDAEARTQKRYRVIFNAATFMFNLENLLLKEKVTLYYDTRFCDLVHTEDLVSMVIVENKSGRSAISCRMVIDTSGDADVCDRAGEETTSLDTNVPAGWFYLCDGETITLQKASHDFDVGGGPPKSGGRTFKGEDADEVTAMNIASHRFITDRVAKRRADAGGAMLYPIQPPSIPSYRMTRRLKIENEMTSDDDHRWVDDCVGMVGHWMKSGPIYYLPYSSLVAPRTDNLLVAGRCTAVDTSAWNITRVIPACAVTGEAAGVAAALAVESGTGRLSELEFGQLQSTLVKQGVIIDKSLAG